MNDLFTTTAITGEALGGDQAEDSLRSVIDSVVGARDGRLSAEGSGDEAGSFDLVLIVVPAGRGEALAHALMLRGGIATSEVHRASFVRGDEVRSNDGPARVRSAVQEAVAARDNRLRELGHLEEVGTYDLVIMAMAPGRGESLARTASTFREQVSRPATEADRTGAHGLPAEYSALEGKAEDWPTTLGYLAALEKSARPIVVAVESHHGAPATQQIGFLRHDGQHRGLSGTVSEFFSVYWPSRDQLSGRVTLYEHLFEGARPRHDRWRRLLRPQAQIRFPPRGVPGLQHQPRRCPSEEAAGAG